MRGILDMAKSTLIGGVLFLLPLIVVIVVVEKAVSVARKVLRPVLGLTTAQQEVLHTVAVYVPGAPSALSGSVLYAERARVARLEAGAHEVFGAMKQLGRESLGLLGIMPGAGVVS